jgi:hypothetical protein
MQSTGGVYLSSSQQHQRSMISMVATPTIGSQNNGEKVKRHYNSEVDPARYRKVFEDNIIKFACSLCGNTYKWRKSLNKHWKEKHITEQPPPLDAPVQVKLRNSNTTITTNGNTPTTIQLPKTPTTSPQQQSIGILTSSNQNNKTKSPISVAPKLSNNNNNHQQQQAAAALWLQLAAANCLQQKGSTNPATVAATMLPQGPLSPKQVKKISNTYVSKFKW